MVLDLTSSQSKANIQSIQSQIGQQEDLAAFNNFLGQFTVIDFNDPTLAPAAQKSCGGGTCCKVTITVSF